MTSFLFIAALSLAQRLLMAHALRIGDAAYSAPAALLGTLADAFPALLLYWLASRRAAWRKWTGRGLAFYTGSIAVLLVLDTAYFLTANNRITGVLLRNIEWLSVRSHLVYPYPLYGAAALAACGAVFFWGLRASAAAIKSAAAPVPARLANYIFGLSGAALLFLVLAAPRYPEDGSHIGFINFSRNRGLLLLKSPSFVSLARAAAGPRHQVISGESLAYSKEEQEALGCMGLGGAAGGAAGAGLRINLRRIVIIASESLARGYLHRWNPRIPAGTTPFLDSLADKYPSLDHYWGGAMPTEEAIYSMLLSRPLYDVDSVVRSRLSPLFPLLRQAGFRSYILRGHSHFYQDAFSLYPLLYGVDRFIGAEEISSRRPAPDAQWGYHDKTVLEETLRVLEAERTRPVIALVSLMDMHPPYYCDVPESDLPQAVSSSGSRLLRSLYSTDKAIGYFFTALQKRGLFDEGTLVLVTSDHRPAYGETASFMDPADYMNWRIPLIFALKNGHSRLALGRDIVGSHIDLGPTILSLLGLQIPPGYWGSSLLAPGRKGVAVGSADDFILVQSPGEYYWFTYDEAVGPQPASGNARVRAVKKWMHNMLLGTTVRVKRQEFDQGKKSWVRGAL